jgi:hypothetical protein
VPVPGDSFEQTLTAASPDLLREMIRAFAQKMMDAEVETAWGTGFRIITKPEASNPSLLQVLVK